MSESEGPRGWFDQADWHSPVGVDHSAADDGAPVWIAPDRGTAMEPQVGYIVLRCVFCPWQASGQDRDAVHAEGRAHVATHEPPSP